MMVTDHGGKDVKNNFFSLCVLCVCVSAACSQHYSPPGRWPTSVGRSACSIYTSL